MVTVRDNLNRVRLWSRGGDGGHGGRGGNGGRMRDGLEQTGGCGGDGGDGGDVHLFVNVAAEAWLGALKVDTAGGLPGLAGTQGQFPDPRRHPHRPIANGAPGKGGSVVVQLVSDG